MKTTLFFLLCINQIQGQSISILRSQLQKHDYIKFCEIYSNKKNLIKGANFGETWGLKRQVSATFHEETKYITIETPILNKTSYNIIEYRICILSNISNIAVYKFQERVYKKIDSTNFEFYYKTLDSFNDYKLIKAFEKEFKSIYNKDPKIDLLFQEEYTFGSYCTIGGNATKGQKEVDSLVSINDTKALLAYLKSENTEKQLFGVVGYQELKKKGYILTTEEQNIIKFILQKKGEVDYCSGCNFENANIQEIMKEYNF